MNRNNLTGGVAPMLPDKDRNRKSSARQIVVRIFAVAEALLGTVLLAGGIWLAVLGGSPYYVVLGIGYISSSVLVWRGRPAGGWLAAAIFVLTLFWAVSESGLRYWPLFPRLLMPAAVATVGLVIAYLLTRPAERRARLGALGMAVGLAGLMVAGFALAFSQHDVTAPPADAHFVQATSDNQPSDWFSYGRTPSATRFAPFTQINRDNVSNLTVAWAYRSGLENSHPNTGPNQGPQQNTPLQIGGRLYICSPSNTIDALDADTGRRVWRFESGARAFPQICRGLGYYATGEPPGNICATRIFTNTVDGRLIALDAPTGRPCPGFGVNGTVQLHEGIGEVKPGFYVQTSAPIVARDKVIVGGFVYDNQEVGEPSGVVRAFNAVTGALDWAWDLGNPTITKLPPPGQTYTRGTPNMWTHASFDDKLGLVYLPLGGAGPDLYGVARSPLMEAYSSSLVAVDVETGRERWKFQTVHHDLWDYDLPAQPALVDLPDDRGGTVPAVLQLTKRGQLFLLNRATGAPISTVVERPVTDIGKVPEERTSPTQPYSVDMPTIGAERLTETSMWGMTMLDQLYCRIAFRQYRYNGDFTPPGLDYAVLQPGSLGGMNWGSASVDPVNLYAFVVDLRIPNRTRMWPRDEFTSLMKTGGIAPSADGVSHNWMWGTPYGSQSNPWLSPLGVPCNQPPFGTVSAVDLKTRRIAWQVPAGTSEEIGPLGIKSYLPMKVGLPSYAGPAATAGGLVFFAGFQDFYLRAYDAATGREVWKHSLPVGASATPVIYVSPATGRQYIALTVGGAAHSKKTGDYVIAFALPEKVKAEPSGNH